MPTPASPRRLAAIDIDGVVADVRHRLSHLERRPKDWDAFFAAAADDPVLPEGVRRVREVMADHDVVFLTGRPERCRRDTVAWLDAQGLGGRPVHMRRSGDYRPARRVKRRELDRMGGPARIAVVIDDDPDVCAELRAAGYTVEQATWMRRPDVLHSAQEREGRT